MLKHNSKTVFGHALAVFLISLTLTAYGSPTSESGNIDSATTTDSLLCPINYVLIDNRCVKGLQNPECDIGSHWDGEKCATLEIDFCPLGFFPLDGECVELPKPIQLPGQ